MTNKNYRKGYTLENNLVKKLKGQLAFDIAFRSAGSHSVIDVVGIDVPAGVISLFQCKTDGRFDKNDTELLKKISKKKKWQVLTFNAKGLNDYKSL